MQAVPPTKQPPPADFVAPRPLQLAERASQGASATGYLNKYRSHAESSLWANTWEVRLPKGGWALCCAALCCAATGLAGCLAWRVAPKQGQMPAGPAPLWTPAPPVPALQLRFVVLKGNVLTYYKREQDVQFPPRGQIDLQVRTGAACVARPLRSRSGAERLQGTALRIA